MNPACVTAKVVASGAASARAASSRDTRENASSTVSRRSVSSQTSLSKAVCWNRARFSVFDKIPAVSTARRSGLVKNASHACATSACRKYSASAWACAIPRSVSPSSDSGAPSLGRAPRFASVCRIRISRTIASLMSCGSGPDQRPTALPRNAARRAVAGARTTAPFPRTPAPRHHFAGPRATVPDSRRAHRRDGY
jgi:hypothetical protein